LLCHSISGTVPCPIDRYGASLTNGVSTKIHATSQRESYACPSVLFEKRIESSARLTAAKACMAVNASDRNRLPKMVPNGSGGDNGSELNITTKRNTLSTIYGSVFNEIFVGLRARWCHKRKVPYQMMATESQSPAASGLNPLVSLLRSEGGSGCWLLFTNICPYGTAGPDRCMLD
jgi:hypothetical protein